MAKVRDKKLMLDVLRYNATVIFRDNYIAVIVPQDAKALEYFSTIKLPRDPGEEEFYVVHTYNNDIIIIRKISAGWQLNPVLQIVQKLDDYKSMLTMPKGLLRNDFDPILKKYPSLYTAFEKRARDINFLPLIKNQTDEEIDAALKENNYNVIFIKNLTHKRKKVIIDRHPGAFRYMPQTIELAKYLISTKDGSLNDVKEGLRSKTICDIALKKDAYDIRYVPQPTEKQKIAAATRDGRVLQYIKNPSFAVKLAAVRSHPDAWQYIKDEKEHKKLKKAK